jgi:hypothetical protein
MFVKEETFPHFEQYYFVFSLYRSNGFIMELLAFPECRFLTPYQVLYFMLSRANFSPRLNDGCSLNFRLRDRISFNVLRCVIPVVLWQ